jgi:hypothetical protein
MRNNAKRGVNESSTCIAHNVTVRKCITKKVNLCTIMPAMLHYTAKTDIDRALRQLDTVAEHRQFHFAVTRALTMTAADVQKEELKTLREAIDRPKEITLKSIRIRPARKDTLEAHVYVDDFGLGKGIAPAKYLVAQIHGGQRRFKRHEVALHRIGVLPQGAYAIPGEGAKMDAHGNMLGGQLQQILSYFRAFGEQGYSMNMTDKRRAALAKGTKRKQGMSYFVGRPGGGKLPLGIWQRIGFGVGSAIRPVLIFVRAAHYQKRFDFFGVATKHSAERFPINLARALREAVSRAAWGR